MLLSVTDRRRGWISGTGGQPGAVHTGRHCVNTSEWKPPDQLRVLRDGVNNRPMPLLQNETAAQWYERAIVANSIAVDRFAMMFDSTTPYNATARLTVQRHADRARADLSAARTAFLTGREPIAERRAGRSVA